ncbi:hypothetical protein [Propionivibrio limicola]|uniref:hypothetical protein n=1 Tax=Propionivibrio limicola TaxID=167645 RepID=UPI001291C45B|nr:hypothetical protein [Propionivibrio limicola]
MTQSEIEIVLNTRTGEVRRNVIGASERYRFHAAYTEEDAKAGWLQVSTFGANTPEEEVATAIAQAKSIYLKTEDALDEDARPPVAAKEYLLYSATENRYYTTNDSGQRADAIRFTETARANLDRHKGRFAPDADWVVA